MQRQTQLKNVTEASAVTPVQSAMLQRKCACGGAPGATGECEDCSRKGIQRKAGNSVIEARNESTVPPMVRDVLRSPGQPLDSTTRSFFEPRFGRDFSDVRIHDDAKSGLSARTVNAHAYTFRNEIVFAPGQYQPETTSGKRLIAHELTHVMQQEGTHADSPQHVSHPGVHSEIEADTAADRIMQGGTPSEVQFSPADTLHREEAAPQGGGRRVPVQIAVLGDCTAPEKIAEALPGARTMLRRAENWFITYPYLVEHQQRWVDALLNAHFGSSSAAVRRSVHRRIISMTRTIELANEAGVIFDCTAVSADKCRGHPWSMFVTRGERNTIHVCPNFFTDGLEARRFTLVHESAHMAGVGDQQYLITAGPIGDAQCMSPTPLSTDSALDNADSFSWIVWCLSREAGVTIISPVDVRAQGQQP